MIRKIQQKYSKKLLTYIIIILKLKINPLINNVKYQTHNKS